ncbi:hypothetical protein BJX66DRAFT_305435 [Aspergillus keveii]|uniref:Uncharacterized protein n=1 Tax=Aspergillus keveii TaxID=714993 RepID=A0ABR4G3Q0_9EURO
MATGEASEVSKCSPDDVGLFWSVGSSDKTDHGNGQIGCKGPTVTGAAGLEARCSICMRSFERVITWSEWRMHQIGPRWSSALTACHRMTDTAWLQWLFLVFVSCIRVWWPLDTAEYYHP